MSTITRERVAQFINNPLDNGLTRGEQMELARIALASLEAEAVAFRSKLKPPSAIGSERWDYTEHRQPDAFELENCVIERLFTAPPAPVSVPDRSMFEKWWESEHGSPLDSWDSLRTTDGYCDDGIDGQFEAWSACRAAMLQGADGNSPVIPDGWVLVPKEPTPAMLNAAWVSHGIYHASAYRTMLAAAPQQEVK